MYQNNKNVSPKYTHINIAILNVKLLRFHIISAHLKILHFIGKSSFKKTDLFMKKYQEVSK